MASRPQPELRRRPAWALQALLLILLVGACFWAWRSGMLSLLSRKDEVIALLREDGWRAPLLCIAVQFLQVVIFVIPGEITQLAAGFVFGVWRGFAYSVVGIMAGSAFNFYFARIVGRPVMQRVLGADRLRKLDRLLENNKGKSAMFLLFLLPGAPKDALTYGAGLTEMTLTEFMVISGFGRSPALLASILIGSHASKGNVSAMLWIGAAVLLAIAACFWYERRRSRRAATEPGRVE